MFHQKSLRRVAALFPLSVPLLAACSSSARPANDPTPVVVARAADAAQVSPAAPPSTYVLMINGGGAASINYQSHLLHLDRFRALVERAGIPNDRVSIFASDGSDPAPDLTRRDAPSAPEFWRLSGTRLERRLEEPRTLIDSRLPGVTFEAASKANLARWFEGAAGRLHPGDTLVVYVTDHGTRASDDPIDNRITLWGKDEHISARELGELVAKLDPGVRVVTLMSQCFSGGFAGLATARVRDGEPSGNVCGYFSSTADRRAYGCYAENLGKENVGHSFEFFRALARDGSFGAAHEAVLSEDTTPDVPLRTSDVYLESLVVRDAEPRHETVAERTDALLREAFKNPGAWEKETRLLDRIARSAGSFSPRSLAELGDLAKKLPDIDNHLAAVTRAWRDALADANSSNLEAFVARNKQWEPRLDEAELAKLDPGAARALSGELLSALATFTDADARVNARLRALRARGDDAASASYRMEVRIAVVLRMRAVLLSIAGRELLREKGTPAQRGALDRLLACEDVKLPGASAAAEAEKDASPAYPPFEEDVKLTQGALPGWMGIRFKDPGEDLQKKLRLPRGAAMVALVFPDSPAKAAGLEAGDIVMGPPGEPFTARNEIRAWTMLSEVGKPGTLEVLRGAGRQRITLTPQPYPMKWPDLPGPPAVGTEAPRLDLRGYRGAVASHVKARSPFLLYFWATWCGPCKAAVPELLAFEKERHVPVIAVTDEGPKVLDEFFKKRAEPFPAAVATDDLRRSFISYAVSGTPTFVLVDGSGKVLGYQTGYDPRRGLNFDGWSWSARPAPARNP